MNNEWIWRAFVISITFLLHPIHYTFWMLMPLHNAAKFFLLFKQKPTLPKKKEDELGSVNKSGISFRESLFCVFNVETEITKGNGKNWSIVFYVFIQFAENVRQLWTSVFFSFIWLNFNFQIQLQIRCIIDLGNISIEMQAKTFAWSKKEAESIILYFFAPKVWSLRCIGNATRISDEMWCWSATVRSETFSENLSQSAKHFIRMSIQFLSIRDRRGTEMGYKWSRRMPTEKWMRRDKVDVK